MAAVDRQRLVLYLKYLLKLLEMSWEGFSLRSSVEGPEMADEIVS